MWFEPLWKVFEVLWKAESLRFGERRFFLIFYFFLIYIYNIWLLIFLLKPAAQLSISNLPLLLVKHPSSTCLGRVWHTEQIKTGAHGSPLLGWNSPQTRFKCLCWPMFLACIRICGAASGWANVVLHVSAANSGKPQCGQAPALCTRPGASMSLCWVFR